MTSRNDGTGVIPNSRGEEGTEVVTNDVGKMALLALVALLAGGGLVTGRLTETAAVGILGTIVGYLTGNGVNAVRRQAPSPVLAPRLPDAEVEAEAVKVAAAQMIETAAEQAQRQGWLRPQRARRPFGDYGLAGPPWRGPDSDQR